MKFLFVPPDGEEIVGPNPAVISDLLLNGSSEYWEAGSGDAGLYSSNNGIGGSELIIMVREPHGVFVQFVDGASSDQFALSIEGFDEETITVDQNGNDWELPRRFFVPRDTALQAVQYFLRTAERAPDVHWEDF